MPRQFHLVAVALAWLLAAVMPSALARGAAAPAEKASPTVSVVPASVPTPPAPTCGAVVGTSNGAILIAGGTSPDRPNDPLPAACVLPPGAGSAWQPFRLRQPVAWGAAASVGDGVICAGGVGPEGVTAAVVRLRYQHGTVVQDQLPDLPAPRMMAGAAVLNGTLFVVGGSQHADGAAPQNTLFSLDLAQPAAGWHTLAALPGPGRLQPIVVAQYDMLEVFGGRTSAAASSAPGFLTLQDAWTYRPRPLDFTATQGWVPACSMPAPLAWGTAVPLGQAHTLLLGCDGRRFVPAGKLLSSSPDPAAIILAYHAVTDTWATLGRANPRFAGATAVSVDGATLLMGGVDGAGRLVVPAAVQIRSYGGRLRPADCAIVVLYVLLITGMGVGFMRRQKSAEEFALGGRRTPWWVAALSLYATATSSISLMAVPALIYATNLLSLFPVALGLFVLIPQAYIVVPLIRRLNLTSTYEYLERRFNSALRLLASFQCIVLYAFSRAAIVILVASVTLSSVTGLNVYFCVLLVGLLTTLYTTLGGIEAVMWTDVLQAGVMLAGPLLVILLIVLALGRGHLLAGAADFWRVSNTYHKLDFAMWQWDWAKPVAWIYVLTVLLQITGFAGDQALVQRVLSTADDTAARRATIGNFIVCAVGAVIVQAMGVALFVYFHRHPLQLDPTMRNDQIVPLATVRVLPVGVAGLMVAGIVAASMSSLSGVVNSAATLIVQDFYLRWRPDALDQTRLRLLKICSCLTGIVATATAAWLTGLQSHSLMEMIRTLTALLGAGFVGVYTLGMFSRRASGSGAIIGAIASVIAVVLLHGFTRAHWELYAGAATLTCIVVGYAASLLLPDPRRDLTGLTVFTTQWRPAAPVVVASHTRQLAAMGEANQ